MIAILKIHGGKKGKKINHYGRTFEKRLELRITLFSNMKKRRNMPHNLAYKSISKNQLDRIERKRLKITMEDDEERI